MSLNTDYVWTWFVFRKNTNGKYFSRFSLFKLTLELTLTRKRRSSRPFSYFRVQLKQQHYSAKKRHPIKHGLSSCIIGKFSFFLSRTCIVVSPSNATSMLLVISFALCAIFVFYVTSSPCRPSAKFHVFCMQFQSQGQLKVILLLRGKRCTWNCHNHYYSIL